MTVTSIHALSDPIADLPEPLSNHELEAQMVELASQIASATCRFLMLVGEYDAREAYGDLGVASMAHWLSWRCGVGMSAAYEQVRVARVLRSYRRLVEEFAAGRLSYSKVRAISRAVTESNIDTLIDYARNASAHQLDRIVAGYRRMSRANDPKAQRAQRALHWSWDEDGSLVGSFRLPPEQGMKFLAALEAGRAAAPVPLEEVEAEEARAVPPCESCTDHNIECFHTSADAHEVRRGKRNNADALELMADLTLAAAEGAQRADTAAMTESPAGSDAEVPAERKQRSWLPGLDISERYSLVIHTSAEVSRLEGALQDGKFADGPGLSAETAQRISCGCSNVLQIDDVEGNPLHLGRKTRAITGRLAKAVHHRDQGRCQAPGCTNRTREIHHSWEWGNGGRTCIDYLISVCSHHHWLVHEGGWSVSLVRRGMWRWNRPDGTEVPTFSPVVEGVHPLKPEPSIARNAIEPKTMSARFDLGAAVGWLVRAA